MRFYLENRIRSIAIERTVEALRMYAPSGVQFVESPEKADVVVIQVNGRLEHLRSRIKEMRKPYVLVQHAYKSTMNPDPMDWIDVWERAELVWSHHDLPMMKNLYHSPLGVSPWLYRSPIERRFLICTSGPSYLTESVRECIIAAEGYGQVLHLGPNVKRHHKHVHCVTGVPDSELALLYSATAYVSGLRRVEGFELPAAEGLCCGARPILFDRPHYRRWYGDLAEYVPERPREEVISSLKDIFHSPYRTVTQEERQTAMSRFDWRTIIHKFYEHFGIYS